MKKKSIKLAAENFVENTDEIRKFTKRAEAHLTREDQYWCYDLAIIRLYREFEDFMLNCLIALINSDPTAFKEELKERDFPDHMNVAVCEYLICGDTYFDFKGRSGLIEEIKTFVDKEHWLPKIVGHEDYKDALDRMCALRNFATHNSIVSKRRALKAITPEKEISRKKMLSSGAWLSSQGRFNKICKELKGLAEEIKAEAPY